MMADKQVSVAKGKIGILWFLVKAKYGFWYDKLILRILSMIICWLDEMIFYGMEYPSLQ